MNFLLSLALAAAAAGKVPSFVYPVRVQIVEATHDKIGRGSGHGNIYDLNLGMRGFDYVYAGCAPFEPTAGDDRYSARWSSSHRLVLAVAPVGGGSAKECTLRTTLRSYLYFETKDGRLTTAPILPGHGVTDAPDK
jgi:hypothetical protein